MAKYDYGGGCPCGLYRECIPQCEMFKPSEKVLDMSYCECGENKSCICDDSQPSTITITKKETVNHPQHYNPGVYEAINVIEHYNLGFHLGNSVKYILRAGKKHDNVKEDIDKAIWYLQRYKETL